MWINKLVLIKHVFIQPVVAHSLSFPLNFHQFRRYLIHGWGKRRGERLETSSGNEKESEINSNSAHHSPTLNIMSACVSMLLVTEIS
jgi:hypothetical protein